MGTSDLPQTSPHRSSSATGSFDRRILVLSAALLLVAIVGGIVAVTVTSDAGDQKENQLREGEIPRAAAIPQPGRGRAPENPGDRGGSEQLGLFAVMLAALVGIGVVILRGSRKTRANRAQWMAAGASGRDGVLDEVPGPTAAVAHPGTTDDPLEPRAP